MSPPTPTIVIAGRPNVGKSTLYNRLTRTRAALVSDMPGLTRDRRHGEAVIGGHRVTIVDTAGLEEAGTGTIPARMRKQSETAIAGADLILFVVDARAGVTPADEVFARIVRAAGQPVVLVANKCEGKSGEAGFYDAFRLGLGEPVAVSAEHGEGLGELERDIMGALGLPETLVKRDQAQDDGGEKEGSLSEAEARQRPLRVAIVGRPNAGKSTLVNALLGEDRMITGPEPGLTRDAVATDLEWGGRQLRLFDTAGLRRKARISEGAEKLAASDAVRAIRFAEVVVLLIDAEHPLEHQDLTIGDLTAEEGRAIVIAVNKWDRIDDKQRRLKVIRDMVAMSLAQVAGVAVVPISALAEKGLDKLMAAVLQAAEVWNRRIPTAPLNRWLEEALERHAPPAASGRRIKLRYMTQHSARPPSFVAFCSRPGDVPKSYIQYLVNGLREAFDLPGVPIRLSLRKSENPYAKSGR
jgi:GTP-binding protein